MKYPIGMLRFFMVCGHISEISINEKRGTLQHWVENAPLI